MIDWFLRKRRSASPQVQPLIDRADDTLDVAHRTRQKLIEQTRASRRAQRMVLQERAKRSPVEQAFLRLNAEVEDDR